MYCTEPLYIGIIFECFVSALDEIAACAEQPTLARKCVEPVAIESLWVLQYCSKPTVRESPTNTEFSKKPFSDITPLFTKSLKV